MTGAQTIIRLVNFLVSVIEAFLGLRFILKLLAANPASTFVSWLYATTEPLLRPFLRMFPSPVIERGSIVEFSTLFAIFIYALVGWLIIELVRFIEEESIRQSREHR